MQVEMPRLEINRQMARISVDTVRARLNVKNHTRSMTMEREPPEMSVRHEMGKVSIDAGEIRANMGLKSSGSLPAPPLRQPMTRQNRGSARRSQIPLMSVTSR